MSFPSRAFIQVFEQGRLPPDYALVVEELKKRGKEGKEIPIITKETDDILVKPLPLKRSDLVVGNFDWTTLALKQLGIPMPRPPDYPDCLRKFLHRKVWASTLGEVQKYLKSSDKKEGEQIFIKPAAQAKDQMVDTLLSGIPGVLAGLPENTPVFCSAVVKMISEYRAYVVNGEIRSMCQYRGPKPKETGFVPLDMDVVKEAINTLCKSEEGKHLTGCGVDFAVLETEKGPVTCLIEVNDGYSLGRYEGVSGKDYTDLLIARWESLMKHEK
eukprot:jgi/Bigna1/56383/estExt_Genewise1Plus.C_970009